MGDVTTVRVGGEGGYDVLVGHHLLDRVPGLLGPSVVRVLLVLAPPMVARVAPLRAALHAAGVEVHEVTVPDAEAAKTSSVAAELWGVLGRAGFTRTDALVAVGGGSVTDLAGFVAATWLRGVRVVQVPSTLLGMVDAAVGGKTGINTAEGKNLVGAFWPPAGVLCDLDLLTTLPPADLVAGMAEVVKCGFIADPRILELLSAGGPPGGEGQDAVPPALRADGPILRELVERAVAIKADVVTRDLRESSLREILNYGHTFGHAVEQVEGYSWRHGEAVSVGMVYAAELACRTGHLAPDLVDRHRAVLAGLGLPTSYPDPSGERWQALLTAMRRDKKTRGALLRFVVLGDIARPVRLEGPSDEDLRGAYSAVTRPDTTRGSENTTGSG